MPHILLIDDDVKLAELLDRFFDKHHFKLSSATLPSTGLRMLATNAYDLVILDIMLPEMDGFEVCKQIRKHGDIPVIMLTARGDVMDRVVGLELGADDYLPKPFEPRELLVRIQNILKRVQQPLYPKAKLVFGKLAIDMQLRQATIEGDPISLSTMEYQLLSMFAQSPGKTFTRDEILNLLKGIDSDILSRSVDILVSRLRQKLKPLDVIKTVRGSGYVFVGQPT